jgi:hypothetical protein
MLTNQTTNEMKTPMLRFIALGLLSAALALAPAQIRAQDSQKPDAGKKEEAAKKKRDTLPFNGKIGAVDKTAKVITVGERKFQITSETKIMKAGKPATLEDAAVGEEIAGAYRKADDGKLTAMTVRIGPRPEGEPKGEKKKKTQNAE